MPQLSQQSYIAGRWVSPTGPEFTAQNPVTKAMLATYASCQETEAEQAMQAAATAATVYRSKTKDEIALFLNTIADQIEELGSTLLEICNEECGLGLPRLTGERGRTTGQLRAFAELVSEGNWVQASIDTAQPKREPLAKPDLRKMLRPLGPVVVFGASNFPFAFGTIGGDTASALAAGNPVVVKGHPSQPATNELFAHAIDKAIAKNGMPAGVFSLLQGNTIELGTALVQHPNTQAVGFTGSLKGGRAIMDVAAARPSPIPVFAEMGSINPVFIASDALATQGSTIVENLADSVCMGTGQFCTSPGVVITVKGTDFANALSKILTDKPRGVVLNKRIGESLQSGLQALASHAEVSWLSDVNIVNEDVFSPPNAVFATSAQAFINDPSLQEEVFGPATLVVDCDNANQMAAVAKSLSGNLTATVHATEKDVDQAAELFNVLEQKAGRVIMNGFPTGVEVCPSQHHGGPYPAGSQASATSVGSDAIVRFARFVSYQNLPDALLPSALQNSNPDTLMRKLNGRFSTEVIS